MEEEYQPTKKEVLGEMWDGVRSSFTKEKASKVGKPFKEFGNAGLEVGWTLLTMPYVIPSFVRGCKDDAVKPSYEFDSNAEMVGAYTGCIGGLVADVGQIVGYAYAVKHDHPEILLIPVATNVASGLYEIGRKMYGNAKQRVLEKHKTGTLEETIETAKQE